MSDVRRVIMLAEEVAALDLDTLFRLKRKRASGIYEKAAFTKTGYIRLARLDTSKPGFPRQINRYGVHPRQQLIVDLNDDVIEVIASSPYADVLERIGT